MILWHTKCVVVVVVGPPVPSVRQNVPVFVCNHATLVHSVPRMPQIACHAMEEERRAKWDWSTKVLRRWRARPASLERSEPRTTWILPRAMIALLGFTKTKTRKQRVNPVTQAFTMIKTVVRPLQVPAKNV